MPVFQATGLIVKLSSTSAISTNATYPTYTLSNTNSNTKTKHSL